MTENWVEKIQQDAELQMLLGLAGGGLVLFVVLLIVIVVRLNKRKKKRAENPLGDIRVQSTHTPQIVEETKEHLVFRNKVSNEITEVNPGPDPEPEPAPVIPMPPVPEIPPIIPEPPVHVPAAPPETPPEPEPIVIPSPPPVVIPPSASEASSEEEKKKEILKAIEETRSREENLRILQERLRELRGETTDAPSPAPVNQPEETLVISEVENTPAMPVEETPVELSEVSESIIEPPHSLVEQAQYIQDEPETAPFVQETIDAVPEPTEPHAPAVSRTESDSPKTFTEWLSALSGKKR